MSRDHTHNPDVPLFDDDGRPEPSVEFAYPGDEAGPLECDTRAASRLPNLDECVNTLLDGDPEPQTVYNRVLALAVVVRAFNGPRTKAALARQCGFSRQRAGVLVDKIKSHLIALQDK